jgi:LCP family protein required for cell wall assembly
MPVDSINGLLAIGGPACLWKTVEHQTGIRIDHFIELDLTGFVQVINDIGGVTVCAPFAIKDPKSGLRLPAGRSHIMGVMALAYWRTREDIGTGSDLQRIQRDQHFMAAVMQAARRSGLLTSPARMLSVIKDTAKAVTTDTGLTLPDLLTIASSLRGLSTGSVQFITAPNIPDPADPLAHVVFQQPQASRVFAAIAHDRTLPKPAKKHQPGRPGGTTLVKTVTPAKVNVKVLNGSGVAGQAGQVASALTSRGFSVTGTGNAATYNYPQSVIEYPAPTSLPAADTLKTQLARVTLRLDTSLEPGTIDLILGSDFNALQPRSASPGSPGQAVAKLSKKYSGITASASCKSGVPGTAQPLTPADGRRVSPPQPCLALPGDLLGQSPAGCSARPAARSAPALPTACCDGSAGKPDGNQVGAQQNERDSGHLLGTLPQTLADLRARR